MSDIMATSSSSYLKVCAHCNDCLNQFVREPDKLNVAVHYRNEKGEFVEWQPKETLAITRRRAFEEALALVNKYKTFLTNPVSEIIEKLEEMKK